MAVNRKKPNATAQDTHLSQVISLPYKFTPREYQLKAMQALDTPGITTVLLRWCRRSGKDKYCINNMMKKAFERVGSYYYVYPKYSQARKALWEGMDKDGFKFMDHVPHELRKSINNNEMKIELLNGSIIRMIGSDDIDSIMGTNPVGVVYSEFSLQNPQARNFMSPILAQNGGWEIINGTPRGKNHMYEVEQFLKNNPKAYVSEVQTLWPDLPNYYQILTYEQLQEERAKGMDEELMNQEYGVSYTAGVQGAYYSDQIVKARKDGRISCFPHDDHAYVDTFWDLGLNDGTAIWFKQRKGNSHRFIDYMEVSEKSVAEVVQLLKEKEYHYRTHYLPHDGNQRKQGKERNLTYKQMLEECLREADLSDDVILAPKPHSKQNAVNLVRGRFSTYYFDENKCLDGITKISLYHKKFDLVKRCFIDHPVHDWCSHAADALSTEALTKDLQDDGGIFGTSKIDVITKFDPFEN